MLGLRQGTTAFAERGAQADAGGNGACVRGGQHPTATGCYLNLRCRINGELCQDGNTNDMLIGFERLIAELSSIWTLRPGDMIYTGTPSGVGPLQIGDVIEVANDQIGTF
ncbi:MAG: hypothetical protein GY875_08905, partial [Gammaproteobacteria bacterium]|nr:hypothetical protein [Gammaproteobacteria bacterium]